MLRGGLRKFLESAARVPYRGVALVWYACNRPWYCESIDTCYDRGIPFLAKMVSEWRGSSTPNRRKQAISFLA